jgi:hypothetical protein
MRASLKAAGIALLWISARGGCWQAKASKHLAQALGGATKSGALREPARAGRPRDGSLGSAHTALLPLAREDLLPARLQKPLAAAALRAICECLPRGSRDRAELEAALA